MNEVIGIFLWKYLRRKYHVSTGIHGGLTFGYGKLDNNGYWQFPVYPPCSS